MKKIYISLLAVITLLLIACQAPLEHEYQYDEDIISHAETQYANEMITYEVTVNKPTPCHEIQHEARVSGLEVLEIIIEIQETDEICAQVITPETITGQIESMQRPARTIIIIE